MKQYILALVAGFIIGTPVLAQQPPTSIGASDPNNTLYWSRTGNNPFLSQNNIFGTLWNSPIYTRSNSANRMKLNGNFGATGVTAQYALNGYGWTQNVNTSGYLLIGQDVPLQTNFQSIYTSKGAFSLLHLNGSGTQVQELGYRPWMQTGITLTGNNDLSYFGLRQIGTDILDRTETVLAWSDNSSGIADEMVFRFIGQASSGVTSLSTNMASADDYDGLHVARFTPMGRFGLGNTFGHIDDPQAVVYNTPQSLFHMSYQFRANSDGQNYEPYGFMQITYRRPFNGTEIIGQGETANDGLRLGIDNQAMFNGGSAYLNSYLRWQERSNFIIQTESETDNNVENDERIRVTSIGALVANYGGNYYGDIQIDNRTRIGISSNGALPVTRPMSLLHLGFDSPQNSGWRNWMDIGSYTTNGNDNMYVGLKRESDDIQNDRFDAVINWGDNISANPNTSNGPDNLRFIFTSNSSGSAISNSNNGMEGARMTPTTVGVYTGFGGIPGTEPYYGGSTNPTMTLEVNGWGTNSAVDGGNSGLRFTNLNTSSLPKTNPGQGFLTVDAEGDVIYTYASAVPGASCSVTDASVGALTSNTRLNLSNNNYYFTNLASPVNSTFNKVAVGYTCGTNLPAKFDVMQKEQFNVGFNSTASHAQNLDIGTMQGMYFIAMRGLANGSQTVSRIYNNGGYFTGGNAEINYGVRGEAYKGTYNATQSLSYGGYFSAQDSYTSYGVRAIALSTTATGYVYGIHASATGGAITRAGYFDGLVQASGYITTSDSMFKDDVNRLDNSLKKLQLLKPVSYTMDAAGFPQMGFDEHLQFGYIAQDVEHVFPNLVYESYRPSDLDSLGNPVDSTVSYKALNYNGFIAINTAAIIELNQKVEKATLSDQSIKTNVEDLGGSLDKVLAMRGVSYDWNHTIHPELNLDSANHVGFIAQEIQQIDPRLTYLADDSLLHVEYDKVVPILAEAIEELNNEVVSKDSIIEALVVENSNQQTTIDAQQETIDDLNNRLSQLENCLSGILPYLCQLSQSAVQANTPAAQEEVRKNLNVTLNDRNAIILDQNVPNPFAEQTIINFSIPATVQKAQIHFYDGNGKLMQSVEVTERGLGSLTVFGSDLSTGVYTYTLVADGQVVATKKMMKQ